jgi:hypothetical protein
MDKKRPESFNFHPTKQKTTTTKNTLEINRLA